MRTYLECMPCFFQQVIEAGRLISDDESVHKDLVDDLARLIPEFPLESSPPEMAFKISQIVQKRSGGRDLYKHIKDKSNKKALELYPQLKKKVARSSDKLLMAVEIAIAGNVIDYGAKNTLDIDKEIERLFSGDGYEAGKTIFEYDDFSRALKKAKTVLYLGDNAGEVLFDRVLIEEFFSEKKVTYVVREEPIINDALADDAYECGIGDVAQVISSGVKSPGTILKYCSEEFLEIFNKAEFIISKGQGNYEALSNAGENIYFLFRAKCPVIARHAGAKIGDMVLLRGSDQKND